MDGKILTGYLTIPEKLNLISVIITIFHVQNLLRSASYVI